MPACKQMEPPGAEKRWPTMVESKRPELEPEPEPERAAAACVLCSHRPAAICAVCSYHPAASDVLDRASAFFDGVAPLQDRFAALCDPSGSAHLPKLLPLATELLNANGAAAPEEREVRRTLMAAVDGEERVGWPAFEGWWKEVCLGLCDAESPRRPMPPPPQTPDSEAADAAVGLAARRLAEAELTELRLLLGAT